VCFSLSASREQFALRKLNSTESAATRTSPAICSQAEFHDAMGVSGASSRSALSETLSLEHLVGRAVDLAYTPCSEQGENLVGAETGTGGQGHRFRVAGFYMLCGEEPEARTNKAEFMTPRQHRRKA
jgi:hypothetical protein